MKLTIVQDCCCDLAVYELLLFWNGRRDHWCWFCCSFFFTASRTNEANLITRLIISFNSAVNLGNTCWLSRVAKLTAWFFTIASLVVVLAIRKALLHWWTLFAHYSISILSTVFCSLLIARIWPKFLYWFNVTAACIWLKLCINPTFRSDAIPFVVWFFLVCWAHFTVTIN